VPSLIEDACDERFDQTLFDRVKIAAAALCIVVGVSVLFGWWQGIETLTRIRPHLSAMNPVTAICFTLSGVALLYHALHRRRAVLTVSAVVGLVAGLKLLNLWLGFVPVDALLFADEIDSAGGTIHLMAPNSATAFLLTSIALTAPYARHRRSADLSQVAAFGVLLIAMFALIGYGYGLSGAGRIALFIPMAIHSGVTFCVLSLGLLCLAPDRGVMLILRQNGPAGAMARTVLPLAILVPIIIGTLRLWGQNAGYYGSEAGVALMIVANVVVTFVLLLASLIALHRSDLVRVERERALILSEQQYRLAESVAKVGHWRLDLAG